MSTKKKTPAGNPPTPKPPAHQPAPRPPGHQAPPPRRRDGVPVLGGSGAARTEPPQLGVPLAQATARPVSDLQEARDEVARVAAQMKLPEPDTKEQKQYVGALYEGQEDLSFRVENGLEQAEEVVRRAQVHPEELILGRRYISAIGEGKRVAILGQNLTADGRLLEGARFSFFFKKVLSVYDQRMKTGTLEVKMQTVRAYANVDKVRFRLLLQAQGTRTATEGTKAGMKQTLAEQQDEAAFVKALKLLEEGQQPDLLTVEAAHRHADRLQEQFGLPLEQRTAGR